MRVALATTHLPLANVAQAISAELLHEVLRILDTDLQALVGPRQRRASPCAG